MGSCDCRIATAQLLGTRLDPASQYRGGGTSVVAPDRPEALAEGTPAAIGKSKIRRANFTLSTAAETFEASRFPPMRAQSPR